MLCDLDGVVWLAHHPIAGSVEAIAALQASGRRVLFVTNNSSATIATQEAALAKVGIDATGDVVSSAMAAALLLEPGQRALVAGGPGVVEALEARGVTAIVNDGETAPGRGSTRSSSVCTVTSTTGGSPSRPGHSTSVRA